MCMRRGSTSQAIRAQAAKGMENRRLVFVLYLICNTLRLDLKLKCVFRPDV